MLNNEVSNSDDDSVPASTDIVRSNNIDVETPTAPEFLSKAKGHMEDRAATYDSPEGERSMGRAIMAFNHITGHGLRESEGWLLLQLLKDTRQWSRSDYHEDSAEDCIAFAALKAEALARGD